jgi:long-chain fatty acid transport protein
MMSAGKAVFRGIVCLMAGLVVGQSAKPAAAQYGPLLSGTGPINRSMGGAATGAPLSAAGALMWNPASLSGLSRSELDVGAELLFPHTSLSSSVGFGALSGTTENEDAVFPLPTIALSYRPEQSPFTYGLGMFAVAGFGLNYPASNPLALVELVRSSRSIRRCKSHRRWCMT